VTDAIPPEAADAPAERAWQAWYEPEHDISRYMTSMRHDEMHRAFLAGWEAAAAERERLAHREAMIGEVKNELDDAFQFTGEGGYRHGYVTREWVEALLATHAASAAAAERGACIHLATEHDATYLVPCYGDDHERGLHTHHRRPFADLLGEEGP
jgi:hypothetical protein